MAESHRQEDTVKSFKQPTVNCREKRAKSRIAGRPYGNHRRHQIRTAGISFSVDWPEKGTKQWFCADLPRRRFWVGNSTKL